MIQGSKPLSPVAPTLAAIEAMHDTMRMARALVEGGRRIDLGGLDVQAVALCTAVLMLPPESGQPLRQALETLVRELDELAATLSAS